MDDPVVGSNREPAMLRLSIEGYSLLWRQLQGLAHALAVLRAGGRPAMLL